jgi:hypothetical protein
VRWIEQVLEAALERQPVPLVDEKKDAEAPVAAAPASEDQGALLKH